MSKVLLVDTNFSSGPIYKYLIASGHEVFLVGRNPSDFLAKSISNYISLDYTNLDCLEKIIANLNIEYLVPGCNDISYEVCSALNTSGIYPGIDSASAAENLNNKKCFRIFALKNSIPVPGLISIDEAFEIKDRSIVVKPVDSFSGKGITIINSPSPEKIKCAIEKATAASREDNFIIEEFVKGRLYSHSAFIVDKKIVSDFIVAEYGSVNPLVVDISHLDYGFPKKTWQKIQLEIEKIAELLELCDGLIHTQFIFLEGDFSIIEITRRCPGDLYSQLIEMSTGYKYAENYTRPFVGEKLQKSLKLSKNLPIVRNTISQDSCVIFSSVDFLGDCNIMCFVPIAVTGDKIKPSPEGRVGILFMCAESIDDIPNLVEKIATRSLYSISSIELHSEDF